MNKVGTKSTVKAASRAQGHAPPVQIELSEEDKSKDVFFTQVAELAEAMISKHGKDFAMGTLVLSAKFIAENKPLINRTNGSGEAVNTGKPV